MGTRFNIVDWRWLAAFTDAEGSIVLAKNFEKRPSQINVRWYQSENQIELLWAIKDFLDEKGISNYWYANESNTNFRATALVWTLGVSGVASCQVVLKGIRPFLISEKKIERADKALEVFNGYKGRVYTKASKCRKGHDMTKPKNIYTRPSGARQCRVCMQEVERNRKRDRRKVAI